MQEMNTDVVKDDVNAINEQSLANENEGEMPENELEQHAEPDNIADESEDDDGEMPAYMKKHFRKQEKELKRRTRELNAQLQAQQEELNSYRQLFSSTYGNHQSQDEPQDEVEQKVLHALNKVQAQQAAARQQIERAKLSNEFQQSLNNAANKYDDFEDVVLARDNPITQTIAEAAQYLPNAGDVLYSLSKNKPELMRINNLSPVEQVKALAEHAIRIGSGQSAKVTQAPKPISGQVRSVPMAKNGFESMSISEMKTHLKNKTKRR